MLLLAAIIIAAVPAAEQAAIFKSAGFVRQGSQWRTHDCTGLEGTSYTPGTLDEFRDLNGDGRPEAVVSEGSGICYGNTGTHFWLLSKQANGSWKMVFSETAVPEFLKVKGVGGWPDLSLGGPGFCFPVLRWNGKAYVHHRFEYEGKTCRPPQ
jgi:hypothetical protein